MPAITLGLAEVEERLRVLRRRLNAVTTQHSAYLSLSVISAVVTALIIMALRGSPSAFRAAAWSGVVLCLAAGAWGVLAARRRWLDGPATAHLADRRGGLTDRLVTLVDLRARPRPSRLAPVLVAQLLALSTQWQPQRIAPRRVPRSVFVLIVALFALGSTAFIERRLPGPAGSTGAGAAGALSATESSKGSLAPNSGAGAVVSDVPPAPGSVPGNLPGGGGPAGREANGAPPEASEHGASSTAEKLGAGSQEAGNPLTALPDRLQDAIRRAFHAEAIDRPLELAARSDSPTRDPGAAQRDEQQGNPDRQPRATTDAAKPGTQAEAPHKGTGAGTQKGPGKPNTGEQVAEHQEGNAANQNYDGKSPAAGDGSSPGALLGGKGEGITAGSGTKTFKLTITSFLRAMEQKGSQARHSGKKTSAVGSATSGSVTQTALNERQLNDDALRKAEIPPEYEDIVRRVYSSRADQ
jgi:hypothetical protein